MARQSIRTSFTSVSWIPSEAISGFMRLPLDIGLGRYDQAPPDRIDDLDAFVSDGRCRFANRLTAWAEIDGGVVVDSGSEGGGLLAATEVGAKRVSLAIPAIGFPEIRTTERGDGGAVTFVQTAGGRTGAPFPRRIGSSRRWKLTAPTAWTTLAITIGADGSTAHEVRGASPFPRHFFYDETNRLVSKSATIDYQRWSEREHGEHTPWGGRENEVLAAAAASGLERTLSTLLMQSGAKPAIRTYPVGELLMVEGEPATSMMLLLDGLVDIEVGGRVVAECGPGSVLGERAFLEEGMRTASVRARTMVKTAEADPSTFRPDDLHELRTMHRREVEGG